MGAVSGRAFDGVRVVELAQWVFVPVAGALLADWGADVIRIERFEGDPYRGLATQGIGVDRDGVNLSLALANRGKRSIALDVQQRPGAGRAAPAARNRPTSSSPTCGPGHCAGSASMPRPYRAAIPGSSTPGGTASASGGPMPTGRVRRVGLLGPGWAGPRPDAARP